VNFAIDRSAIQREIGSGGLSQPTDQYLPPGTAGFRDVRIYPFHGNLRRARALARGRTRTGKAVLYTFDRPPAVSAAQIVRRNLASIGIDVDVKVLPFQVRLARLLEPGEPWDIGFFFWTADYVDPFQYVNTLFDGRFIGETNFSRFNSVKYNRLLRHAAGLRGEARYRAYGKLDVQLAREAAPYVVVGHLNEPTFVSKRVDLRCVVLRPTLDLTAVCLNR
jgi:ABC-type transport system substrate-binding protein